MRINFIPKMSSKLTRGRLSRSLKGRRLAFRYL